MGAVAVFLVPAAPTRRHEGARRATKTREMGFRRRSVPPSELRGPPPHPPPPTAASELASGKCGGRRGSRSTRTGEIGLVADLCPHRSPAAPHPTLPPPRR